MQSLLLNDDNIIVKKALEKCSIMVGYSKRANERNVTISVRIKDIKTK